MQSALVRSKRASNRACARFRGELAKKPGTASIWAKCQTCASWGGMYVFLNQMTSIGVLSPRKTLEQFTRAISLR